MSWEYDGDEEAFWNYAYENSFDYLDDNDDCSRNNSSDEYDETEFNEPNYFEDELDDEFEDEFAEDYYEDEFSNEDECDENTYYLGT